MAAMTDLADWFGILELPFLLITVAFAFLTARNLRGGVFGRGMALLAAGFLIMAVGHLHLQLKHFFDLDIFTVLFDEPVGSLAWFLAHVLTRALSAIGFYSIDSSAKPR